MIIDDMIRTDIALVSLRKCDLLLSPLAMKTNLLMGLLSYCI